MQEQVSYEDIEFKDYKKADRMLRSESARQKRKEIKAVREMKVINEWARSRRARKAAKKD